MEDVFHTYDIRGQYPDQLDTTFARNLGNAVARYLKADHVIVGYDARDCSKKLHDALIDGFTDAGVDVTTAGLASTPLIYYLVTDYDGGIMVTASHNPPGYGGFKLTRGDGSFIGLESGLRDIKERMQTYTMSDENATVDKNDYTETYATHLTNEITTDNNTSIIVDASNGSAGKYVRTALEKVGVDHTILHEKPDGSFPNHSPNPLVEDSQETIRKRVQNGYDMGALLDADGDRVVFFDEDGNALNASTIIALHAQHYYEEGPVVVDVLNYRPSVIAAVEHAGIGIQPVPTGYVHVRDGLEKYDGVAGAEYSGHYSHADTNNADNSILAMLKTIHCLNVAGEPLSALTETLEQKTVIQANFSVEDKEAAIDAVDKAYPNLHTEYIDGVSKTSDNDWFNVRKSNTEPVIRVTVEANNRDIVEQRIDAVQDVLGVDEVESYS